MVADDAPSAPSATNLVVPSAPGPSKTIARRSTWGLRGGVAPAISLRQPWAWAVVRAGKVVENREAWRKCAYRGSVLIHAARGMTRKEYDEAVEWMWSRSLVGRPDGSTGRPSLPTAPPRAELLRGCVVGVARIVGVVERGRAIRGAQTPIVADLTREERAWWMGTPYHHVFALLLEDAVALDEPVVCGGALGLFTPVPEVYRAVARSLARALSIEPIEAARKYLTRPLRGHDEDSGGMLYVDPGRELRQPDEPHGDGGAR